MDLCLQHPKPQLHTRLGESQPRQNLSVAHPRIARPEGICKRRAPHSNTNGWFLEHYEAGF